MDLQTHLIILGALCLVAFGITVWINSSYRRFLNSGNAGKYFNDYANKDSLRFHLSRLGKFSFSDKVAIESKEGEQIATISKDGGAHTSLIEINTNSYRVFHPEFLSTKRFDETGRRRECTEFRNESTKEIIATSKKILPHGYDSTIRDSLSFQHRSKYLGSNLGTITHKNQEIGRYRVFGPFELVVYFRNQRAELTDENLALLVYICLMRS